MMTSQFLKSMDFTKTQKSLSRERNITLPSNKKIHELHMMGYFMAKNTFGAEITFKFSCRKDGIKKEDF